MSVSRLSEHVDQHRLYRLVLLMALSWFVLKGCATAPQRVLAPPQSAELRRQLADFQSINFERLSLGDALVSSVNCRIENKVLSSLLQQAQLERVGEHRFTLSADGQLQFQRSSFQGDLGALSPEKRARFQAIQTGDEQVFEMMLGYMQKGLPETVSKIDQLDFTDIGYRMMYTSSNGVSIQQQFQSGRAYSKFSADGSLFQVGATYQTYNPRGGPLLSTLMMQSESDSRKTMLQVQMTAYQRVEALTFPAAFVSTLKSSKNTSPYIMGYRISDCSLIHSDRSLASKPLVN